AERRAVRGVPVEDAILSESPELRELRRFEEGAFPRDRTAITGADGPADVVPPPLPAGLEGRWGGSGDIPPEVRSPGARPEGRGAAGGGVPASTARLRVAARPGAARAARALGAPGAAVPGVLQERHPRPLDHDELGAQAGPLPAHVRARPRAPRPAQGSDLPG